MITSTLKSQPYDINVTEILLKSSWHTPKTSQAIHIYSTKVKKPLYGFFTHLFYSSETIQIFCGLFVHDLSRIIKFKHNFQRVPTTEL